MASWWAESFVFNTLQIAIYSCMFRYYHQMDKFHNLLRLLSNEVVHRAIAMVGEDILREPLEVCKGDVIFKENSWHVFN